MSQIGVRKSKSSKRKKQTAPDASSSTESSTFSQISSVNNELSDLDRQYQVYKQQFDEWTVANKSTVSKDSFDNYVQQFKTWEKQVEIRRNQLKASIESSHSSSIDGQTSVAATDSSAAVPLDPSTMMMSMMTTMMMSFMMMNQQQQLQTVGEEPQPSQVVVDSSKATLSGEAVSYKKATPPIAEPFIPLGVDFSKPPPAPVNRAEPEHRIVNAPARQVDFDRSQRAERYFQQQQRVDNDYYRNTRSPNNYDDFWYRRYQERRQMELQSPAYHQSSYQADNSSFRPRSPQNYPLERDGYFRSGLGAADFSMRRGELQRQQRL